MAESERHVRLFRNGRNRAVRIPREFELEGNEAILRKEGDRLRSRAPSECRACVTAARTPSRMQG